MRIARLLLAAVTGARSYDFRTYAGRWSREDATRVEERLNRRLGQPFVNRRAADPEAYATWRSALVLAAVKRLLKDRRLGGVGRTGESHLSWRQLTVGERLFIIRGGAQHLRQFGLRQTAQQLADHGAQGNGFARLNGLEVVSVDQADLSCVSQPGEDAESPAGETAQATTRDRSGCREDVQ